MNRLVKLFVLLLSLAGWGLWSGEAMAATRYAVSNGAWNLTSTWSTSSGGGSGASVPVAGDVVNIGETSTSRTPTIPAGYTAACATLNIGGSSSNSTLTLSATDSVLNVSGNITINRPTSNTHTVGLNVNVGTVNVTGSVVFAGTSTTASRDIQITITTGSLTIGGDLVFTAGVAGNNTITMSGGAGTINLAGNFTSVAGGYTAPVGTLTPGTTSTVNFNGSTVAQTIPIGVSSIIYHNIYVNNTNASGATLSAAITGTNVTGNLSVQRGILNNGGFAIASGGGGDVFEVASGAQLNLTGTSSFPTSYTTNTLGATSTVNYGGAAQTVANVAYGNLMLSGNNTKTMPGTAMVVAGDFTMSGTATTTTAAALTVGGNLTIGASNTLANGSYALSVAGNYTETGTFTPGSGVVTLNGLAAVQTLSGAATIGFTNLTVNNSGGILLTQNVTVTSAIIGTVTLTNTCPTDWKLTSNSGLTVQHSCPPTAPSVTTNAASPVSITGATLNGTVSSNRADTAVTFDYWVTSGPVSSITATPSPVLGSNTSNTSVSAAVTGLICGTTYNFHAKGVNSVGTSTGSDLTFTTLACAAPTVTTLAANALSMSGATLNGTVSSNGADTAVTFEYGLNAPAYGSSITATPSPVLGSNSSSTSVSAAVTGLICNTLYNFRAKGVNSVGTTNGGNLTFTTSACPSLGSVINTYYPGSTASVAVGSTSIILGAATTGVATSIAIGDTLIIMQMQDASINSANTDAYGDGTAGDKVGSGTTGVGGSGVYEYVIAASNVSFGVGGTLTLACGTANAYSNAAATGTAGQKTYQVIRVPVYPNVTLTSTLTAQAWNGSTGGVLAFDVTGAVTLNSATVQVDGMGFRGGASRTLAGGAGANTDYLTLSTVNNNASKGEGIAGTPHYVFTAPSTLTNTGVEGYPNGSNGRGAPANAGGGATDLNPGANDENPGGGGGGNGGTGGLGGIGWCPTFVNTSPYYGCGLSALVSGTNLGGSTGGFGGAAVTVLGAARLTLGGGGGGGTTNGGSGTLGNGLSSSGAAGGGIIMLRAGSMSGTATFNANGSNGDSTVANDGTGGGGAGGAVLISAGSGMGFATINVKGGNGGTNLGPLEVPAGATNTPHGPGGGGGGGYAITTGAPAGASSAAAGANGVTYNSSSSPAIFGAYGSTPGYPGSLFTGLAAASIPGTKLGATSCIDHYQLFVPASSITCLPTTVTVTACADNSNPCTSVAAGVSGTANLASTGGKFDSSGLTTVTATIAASVASTTLSDPGAADGTKVTVTLTSASPAAQYAATCNIGGDCSVIPGASTTFHTAGFIFSTTGADGAPEATVPDQVAGVSFAPGPYWLRSVITSTTTKVCQAAFTSPHPVTFNYQCIDPASCSGGNWLTIGSTTFGSAGTIINLTFDGNGIASLGNFNFGDVGRIGISASATSVASATTVAGATLFGTMKGTSGSNFVVKAYDFGVVPCVAAVLGNCITAPTDPGLVGGGSVFAKAGEAFKATVTARSFGGAATPNFGGGSNNGTEAVNLTRTRQAPTGVGTVDGALGGTTSIFRSSFSNGIATSLSDLSWSEVGVITLTATNTTFLTKSLSTTGTSGNLGRFYPDHFGIAPGIVVTRSDLLPATGSSFTYMDEPMKLSLVVSAYNKNEGLTQNYTGSFAKLDAGTLGSADLSKWTCTSGTQCMGLAAVFGSTPLTSRLVIDTTSTNSAIPSNTGWSGGTSYFTLYATVGRNASPVGPDGPFDAIKFGVKPLDADGVTVPPKASTDTSHCVNLNAATGAEDASCTFGSAPETDLRRKIFETGYRFGRLHLFNAYGSELLPIRVPIRVEYCAASNLGVCTNWQTNANDSLTPLSAGNVAIIDNTIVRTFISSSPVTPGPSGSLSVYGGQATMILARPGCPSGTCLPGISDLALNLNNSIVSAVDTSCNASYHGGTVANMPWLQGFWAPKANCNTYDPWKQDPNARIKFGSPKAPYIYLRERY